MPAMYALYVQVVDGANRKMLNESGGAGAPEKLEIAGGATVAADFGRNTPGQSDWEVSIKVCASSKRDLYSSKRDLHGSIKVCASSKRDLYSSKRDLNPYKRCLMCRMRKAVSWMTVGNKG